MKNTLGLFLGLLLTLVICTGTVRAGNDAPKEGAVPTARLRELRQMMVNVEADAPAAEVRRQLNSVMREGRALLREYRGAENVYVVRHVMLEAARRLLALGEPVPREEVVGLARDIVEADPPPEWRFSADVLLAQMRAAQAADAGEVREALDRFVELYRDQYGRPFAAKALMRAAETADALEVEDAYDDYVGELYGEYSWEPGVVDFLMSEGVRIGGGRHTFAANLPLMDGRTLIMPQETFGDTTVVLFWSARTPRCIEMMEELHDLYKRLKDRGLFVVCISLDGQEDEALVREVLREKDIPWPQVFTGKGPDDPFALHYGIRQVPAPWVVSSVGQTVFKPNRGAPKWRELESELTDAIEEDFRRKLRQWDARSGLWRADAMLARAIERAAEPGAVPDDELEELLDALFRMHMSPHMTERIEHARSLQADVRELLKSHPEAPNAGDLKAVQMAILQYRALTEEKPELQDEALSIARELLAAKGTPDVVGLICDYLLLRGELSGRKDAYRTVDEKAGKLKTAYEGRVSRWQLKLVRYMLLTEYGARGWFASSSIQLKRLSRQGRTTPRVAGMVRCLIGSNTRGRRFRAELERFDGSPLVLPDDLLGKNYVLHFWTMDYPPAAEWFLPLPPDRVNCVYNKLEPIPERDYVIVGVNLDSDREAVQAYAEKHFPDWIHTYVGEDREHPLVRENDIQALPSSWLVLRNGDIEAGEQDRYITGLGLPRHSMRAECGRLRDDPMDTVDRWEPVLKRYRRVLRLFELHWAMDLPLQRDRSEEANRSRCAERGHAILRAGLEVNKNALAEHREALREALSELERNEAGDWVPAEALEEAWDHVRMCRRAAQNLQEIAEVAPEAEHWMEEEYAVEEYRAAAEAVEPPDLPEGFPEPPPEED